MRLEKRKLIYLVVCIIVLPQITIAGSIHEVNQAWKERGYVAIARLESLAGKSDKMSQYKRLLEFAYATHVAPEKYDFVYKLENGTHFYKLILNKSKNPNTKTGVDEAGEVNPSDCTK